VREADMNYLKTFFITTILLSMHSINYGAEPQTTDIRDIVTPTQQPIDTQDEVTVETTEEQEEAVETKEKENELQDWNDHLELLTIESEYWDKENNIPTDEWKSQAFDIAKKVLEKDKTYADTLKTAFLDAINAKISLEKGKFTTDTINLIKELDDLITTYTTAPAEETEETTEPAPVTPAQEEAQPEPVGELPSTATETPTTTETSTSPTTTTPVSDVSNEWKEQINKVKREGTTFGEIDAILNQAYDLANQLLSSGNYKQQDLQADFYDALEARSLRKNLYPLNVSDTMNFFNRAIGIFVPEEEFSYHQPTQDIATQQELQKLREEYAQKDAAAKAEREQQKQKEMQIQAALAEARKREQETQQAQESKIQRLQVLMEQKIAKSKAEMEAASQKREKELREAFTKNIEQMAAAQKAAAEKGILSTITEAVSSWWYGPGPRKPGELSPEEQNKMFDIIAENTKDPAASKVVLKEFQNKLLTFMTPQFWDEQREIPNKSWIIAMQKIIFDIAIAYEIMPVQEATAIVTKVLQASGKIAPANISFVSNQIQKMVKEHERKMHEGQQRQEAIKQQKAQLRRDQQEQILLAQQKIKDEQARKEQEIKKQDEIKVSYKDEKKQWYDLLDKVAQNKQATSQELRSHTQEALKKSQTLMHLAGDIPTKNKTALSQKLKQKFSVALLNQQKDNPQSVNIYHDMDIFNQEINKLMD